jgi:hypothetical protein
MLLDRVKFARRVSPGSALFMYSSTYSWWVSMIADDASDVVLARQFLWTPSWLILAKFDVVGV